MGLVELWLWKYHHWTEAIADHLASRSVVPAAKMSLITWEDLKPGFVTEPKEKSVFSLENRNFLFSPSEAILPSQKLQSSLSQFHFGESHRGVDNYLSEETEAVGHQVSHSSNFDLDSPKAGNHFEGPLSTFLLDVKSVFASH